jgi:hypothetical protein
VNLFPYRIASFLAILVGILCGTPDSFFPINLDLCLEFIQSSLMVLCFLLFIQTVLCTGTEAGTMTLSISSLFSFTNSEF